jgi:hypothetical protein
MGRTVTLRILSARAPPRHISAVLILSRATELRSSYGATEFLNFISEFISKIQPYPVHVPGAMPETLELSESVNSVDLVILNILYLGL